MVVMLFSRWKGETRIYYLTRIDFESSGIDVVSRRGVTRIDVETNAMLTLLTLPLSCKTIVIPSVFLPDYPQTLK